MPTIPGIGDLPVTLRAVASALAACVCACASQPNPIHGQASEGAGTGAISGAALSMLDADREKQQVVKRCVAGRGYHVLN